MTFKELRQNDVERLRSVLARYPEIQRGSIYFTNAYWCILLHRLAHALFQRKIYFLARLLWNLNLLFTGADISPSSKIGPGFVILYPVSVTVAGCAGNNFLVMGQGGLGGGMTTEDIGAGPGMPLLGDDVTLPFRTMVLGAVKIGSRAQLPAGVVISNDVAAGAVVELAPFRTFNRNS